MARILVIEDNLANLELMTYLLNAFGHTTVTAQDGAEGLKVMNRAVPELILCDVHLPVMDGYEIARRLKSHPYLCLIPLVAVTALAMVGDRDLMLAAGFDGYIAKPIVPETFVNEVEEFLLGQQSVLSCYLLQAPQSSAMRQSAKKTLLIVDNQPLDLELACSMLQASGYAVLTAGHMGEALTLARRARPDLILSDINMADDSGYDFITAVQADPQLRAIPFMFITPTLVSPSEQAKGLRLGAVGFLCRPLDPRALLAEIEAYVHPARGG